MARNFKLEKLLAGETITTSEKGNSMVPLIESGQEHILSPISYDKCEVGDIVYCRVKGRYYTHKVLAVSNRGLKIGNNKGGVNGWTKAVYGKVTKILPK